MLDEKAVYAKCTSSNKGVYQKHFVREKTNRQHQGTELNYYKY
jgi:hypothetical protein